MSQVETFRAALTAVPLIAIIRGVRPDEAEAIGDAILSAGFRILEVPLNSPDPFDSIARLAKRFGAGAGAVIGGGTVLDAASVGRVRDAGGTLVVSPNSDMDVIAATVAAGMASAPGFFTVTEAFRCIAAGASAIKLFPAEAVSPAVVKGLRAVLPKSTPLLAVGGVTPDSMAAWRAAGADGFGLGGALYKPGMSPAQAGANARAFMRALGE